MQHSQSAGSLMLAKDEFDHIFSDQELQHFLDRVAAADGPHDDVLIPDGPLGLQFLPPEPIREQEYNPGQGLNGVNTSAMSSFDELPRSASATAAAATQANAAVLHNLKALTMMQQALVNGSSQHGGNHALDAISSLTAASPMTSLPLGQPAFSYPNSVASARGTKANEKPQISHSTVEKQRRDRINSLIDELRDLVPPSKATMAAAGGARDIANTEARRPKHVVLADTIALLKQLAQRGPLSTLLTNPAQLTAAAGARPSAAVPDGVINGLHAMANGSAQPAVQVKEEPHVSPSNSNSKGSVSSHEDMEMKDDGRTNAPKLPVIPIQPTQLSGVSVERGPDCMYVQVKCRDRKGLLLDIINAMKQLPLEVRTAAVTTQDGLVRDVFEVKVDDQSLQPEEVQNMVHEALFQQWAHTGEKRARC